jgi:hypothetical protein
MDEFPEWLERRYAEIYYGPFVPDDVVLPDTVVMPLERLKKIRAILRRKFKLSLEFANVATAAVTGFENYYYARKAYWENSKGASPDEDCPADVIIRRREAQANMLITLVEADPRIARQTIGLVRPTMLSWKPSLRAPNPLQPRRTEG